MGIFDYKEKIEDYFVEMDDAYRQRNFPKGFFASQVKRWRIGWVYCVYGIVLFLCILTIAVSGFLKNGIAIRSFRDFFDIAPILGSIIISTIFVLSVSYCMSRMRFKMRRPFMNIAMVLGLFPGFMSMVAVYYILKALNMSEGSMIPIALVVVFSAGTGLGFYVAKGFFDTIPKSLDEAAIIDGATRWKIFTNVTIPLSKPIIVYTILTSFMSPWIDFLFAKVICRADAKYYTVSIGLWKMLEKEYIDNWYTSFAAGAVLVSIPIAILFLMTQKFYVEGMSGAVKG